MCDHLLTAGFALAFVLHVQDLTKEGLREDMLLIFLELRCFVYGLADPG